MRAYKLHNCIKNTFLFVGMEILLYFCRRKDHAMKKSILLHIAFFALMSLLPMSSWALDIPKGTLYFDNTKTNYSHVQFVFGKETEAESYVYTMNKYGSKGLWAVTIPATVTNMYRFTFSNTTLSDGFHNESFVSLKDYISNTINCNRTATRDDYITAGYVFVPESSDNWAQGTWISMSAWEAQQSGGGGGGTTTEYSGTLPVMYIETQNHATINSKETYINGTIYINALNTGYDNFASATQPLAIQIKGRGNYTWRDFDKKPYKIKFADKYALLGMPSNKHWCLMAYADDDLGYLRNPVGFRIAEDLKMLWTPHYVPVEVFLNGKYWGLYFLTEQIRIGKNRLPLKELEDNCSNPDSITGGWLVEIDNYSESGNITFSEGNGQDIMITPKSPEILSSAERTYITNQMNNLNSKLYGSSESALQAILDFDEAAKFYLVQEILEDCESYHGSCYLYKDRDKAGEAQKKWCFGPVWDKGNSYMRNQERFIYDNPIWSQIWIGQLATWPAFQKAVKEQWYIFYHDYKDRLRNDIAAFASLVSQAAVLDGKRWNGTQNYRNNSQMNNKKNEFLNKYNARINWLYKQWGEGIKPDNYQPPTDNLQLPATETKPVKVFDGHQIIILHEGHAYDLLGRPIR